MVLPRGIRNKNPLNLRIGNDWFGEVSHPTDPYFEQFQTMALGLRAGFKVIRRYIERYQRNTIPLVISSWAPMNENNTERYIDFVCDKARISRTKILDFNDREQMCRLVDAMALYECGQRVEWSDITKAYDML